MNNPKRRIAAFLLWCLLLCAPAWAHTSKEWQKTLDARTVRVWIDAQFLDDIVLNARAELSVTWLPQSLQKRLDRDRDVPEWVLQGLGFYYSSNKETRQRMKGRDVLALNYRAVKNWNFDPTQLSIGGYRVASEDLLGHKDLRVIGELPSGTVGTLFLSVPSLKPGRNMEIMMGSERAELRVPAR